MTMTHGIAAIEEDVAASAILAPPARPRRRPVTRALLAFLPALVLALLAMGACHATLGVNLGLFFAGVFVAALLVPPMALADEAGFAPLLSAIGVAAGVSAVWLYAALHESITLDDALTCSAVIGAFALGLAGLAVALRRIARLPSALAAFVAIVLALAWLTWPVWLSPWIPGRDALVARLAEGHPLLTINAALRHLGLWDEQRYAYRMTALVRDVSYAPPRGVRFGVLLHAIVGGGLLGLPELLSRIGGRRAARRTPAIVSA